MRASNDSGRLPPVRLSARKKTCAMKGCSPEARKGGCRLVREAGIAEHLTRRRPFKRAHQILTDHVARPAPELGEMRPPTGWGNEVGDQQWRRGWQLWTGGRGGQTCGIST